MEEAAPTEEPKEEPTTLMAMGSELAGEPNIPPLWGKKGERGEIPRGIFPGWMEVLHPAQLVIPTGWMPPTLSGLRWQCSSQSAVRRAQHQCTKEQQQAMQKSNLTSLPGSPKPKPKIVLPLGFTGVSACLMRNLPSSAPIEAPQEIRQPYALVGPTVAMMYTTHIVQDEATGVTYLDTVTTSIGRVALGNPHIGGQPLGAHHRGYH